MNHFTLPLSGLHCMGCARKVDNTLKALFNANTTDLSPSRIEFEADASLDQVIEAIESLGYQIVPQYYALQGLHCGNCVKKLRKTLEATHNACLDSITTDAMVLRTGLTETEVADLATSLGFSAKKTESAPQIKTAETQHYALDGLHCGNCVKKLRQALEETCQVTIDDISTDAMSVTTTLSSEAIIDLVESVGYAAQPITHTETPALPPLQFALDGLHCGNCVKKLRQALEETGQVTIDSISTKAMSIVTDLTDAEIAHLAQSLGYSATHTPDDQLHQPLPDNSETATSPEPTSSTIPSSDSDHATFFLIKGMSCASCVSSVEKALNHHHEVKRAQVNLAEQSAIVYSSAPLTDISGVINAVAKAGYQAEQVESPELQQEKQQEQLKQVLKDHIRNAVAGLVIGIPIMFWGLLGGSMDIHSHDSQIGWGVIGLICLLLLATAGRQFYRNAWQSLLHRRATMDTLIAMGTGAAWLYSITVVLFPQWFPPAARHIYFEATAMIIGLISLGHAIEANAKAKTTHSLQSLIKLQPKQATVINDQKQEQQVDIAQIQLGMMLSIKPGEQIPVDGVVISGESYIDESMLTGEPIPSLKTISNNVSAGTFNQDGHLVIQATSIGADTMLARIIKMVRTAQSSKPQIAKMADAISAVFVPVVISIAVIAALIWFFIGPAPQINYMLIIATTILVIACPCALGLATPLSITAGIGKAAELGILIRDADALQTTSQITTVVFDKTGTLTQGKPSVQHFENQSGNAETTLQIAYAMEQKSEHPLAKAICDYARDNNIMPADITQFENQRGKGLSAIWQGKSVTLGSLTYLKAQGVPLSDLKLDQSFSDNAAVTPVGIAIENTLFGVFLITDELKSHSIEAVHQLNARGIETIMLTGDTASAAQSIARTLGIKTVIADVLPDKKAEKIRELQDHGAIVAMLGDGINDAPALAQANVGIAMGSGSDIAIETAHMTFLNSSPLLLLNAIELSQATLKNIRQNLIGAFLYNSLGIPIAAGVLYPLMGFLLNPVVAGCAMALSSITVVTNANRLRRFKPSDTRLNP